MAGNAMTGDALRDLFRSFFEEKGHLRMPSGSLIPVGDPTLLLTSAGMVPFKPYFTGEATPPRSRLTSCQKCFRTSDIESVGDTKHLTFFEMLGNFSIGDYFKPEVIPWAWELMTKRLGLPADRLWVTVYTDDDEAFHIWRDVVGVPEERIYRYGRSDNFWGPAGSEGPCGPCSEIHYDFGAERGCRPMAGSLEVADYKTDPDVGCHPNCDRCARFVELWNLVFMQFYQHLDGSRTPLPRPSVDTGMGLERMAAVLQGKDNVYDTDLFAPIIAKVAELANKTYGQDQETDKAIRVVVEHSRAVVFLIADGVVPGNEGREYVLRRVLRRAIRFGRRLGLQEPFLKEMAQVVIDHMGSSYPQLVRERQFVLSVIQGEEERFGQTFGRGLAILDGMVAHRKEHVAAIPRILEFGLSRKPSPDEAGTILEEHGFHGLILYPPSARQVGEQMAGQQMLFRYHDFLRDLHSPQAVGLAAASVQDWARTLSDAEVFLLHDTYGFPLEVTQEIAKEHGLSVDLPGFEREMEQQRKRARAADRFDVDVERTRAYEALGVKATRFVGYDTLIQPTVVVGLLVDGQVVTRASEGQQVEVVLRETPFYPEGGGQAGDGGEVLGPQGAIHVEDTQRPVGDLVVHVGRVVKGAVELGDLVEARVDPERRLASARNHTGTHLLHAALRDVLGSHVRQAGSLVTPDRLRLDFTSPLPITQEDLQKVERLVNQKVRENLNVHKRETSYQAALQQGALAFFGEKYADQVRVVEVANPSAGSGQAQTFSLEVCGGTHLERTGEVGAFVIVSESSVGSGMRRIEALTGHGAEAFIRERLNLLQGVADLLQTSLGELEGRAKALTEELDLRGKRIEALERQGARQAGEGLLSAVQEVNGTRVLAGRAEVSSVEALREMGDWLRDKLGSGIVVLGAVFEGRPTLVAMVTGDLVAMGFNAAAIVREVAKVMEGSGGGRPNLAQAGGRRPEKLEEALASVAGIVAAQQGSG
ncbi:MAG: alanine--tRNA ligase [Dehalococcoidia bacterium]|nr:alanine--tRNA ligase [Dehalococcoidia bacterium]